MLTEIVFAGLSVVFLGLALSALAIYAADGRGIRVHERLG